MPTFLGKDFLSEHLRFQRRFLQNLVLVVPEHLDHVVSYLHSNEKQHQAEMGTILEGCEKNTTFTMDDAATINEVLETAVRHEQNHTLSTVPKIEPTCLDFQRANMSKNLVQMDSDSDYSLFSSCETNLDDEKQSIVNSIVSGSSLPSTDDKGYQGLFLEEFEDTVMPYSAAINVNKLIGYLKPVRMKDPFINIKIMDTSISLEKFQMETRNEGVSLDKIELDQKDDVIITMELEEMERNPNEKHTTVSDVDVLPLNGLHKEDVNKEASEDDFKNLKKIIIQLETYKYSEDEFEKHCFNLTLVPTQSEDQVKLRLESPCSTMGDVSCNNFHEMPHSCEKIQMIDDANSAILEEENRNLGIADVIRRQESCYGDMLLLLLPEDESSDVEVTVPLPKLPKIVEKFDSNVESNLEWDPHVHAATLMAKAKLSIISIVNRPTPSHVHNPFQGHFKKCNIELLNESEDNHQITDWKLQERKYKGLKYINAIEPQATSSEHLNERQISTKEHSTDGPDITFNPSIAPAKTTRPSITTRKFVSDMPRRKTEEEPFQSPLDSFLLLRTGFKCSTPRDTPRSPPATPIGAKKIGVIQPVTTVSAAKVKPMIVTQHKPKQPTLRHNDPDKSELAVTPTYDVSGKSRWHRTQSERVCNTTKNPDRVETFIGNRNYGNNNNTNHNINSDNNNFCRNANKSIEEIMMDGNEGEFSVFTSTKDTPSVATLHSLPDQLRTDSHSSAARVILTNPQKTLKVIDGAKATTDINNMHKVSTISDPKVSIQSKTAKIDVVLVEEFLAILMQLEKDSSSLVEYLKDVKVTKPGSNLFTFTVDQTRFLLKEEEKKQRSQCGDKDVFCGLICLHALCQLVDLIVHCNIPTACGVLKSINQKYQSVLRNSLEPVRKKLIAFHCQNEDSQIYHPKFQRLKELILQKTVNDFAVKFLVLIGRYFEQTSAMLMSFLGAEDSIVVKMYPNSNVVMEQAEYMEIFLSSNVILAEENAELQACPWKYFHYVIQYEYRAESEWSSMVLSQNPALHMFFMLNANIDNLQQNTHEHGFQQITSKQQIILVCDQCITRNKELLVSLERQNNIHLIPKNYHRCLTNNKNNNTTNNIHEFTTQPHFMLSAKTCIHILFEDVLTSNDTNGIFLDIISVILKCSSVHFIIASEKMCHQKSRKMSDQVTSVISVLRKNFEHVTIRTWCTFSTADLARKIRSICDNCSKDTLHPDCWNSEMWLKDQLSPQEIFLMHYPFMNLMSAEIMLQKTKSSLRTLFTITLKELNNVFQEIPQHTINALHKAINHLSTFNALPPVRDNTTTQHYQRQQDQQQHHQQELKHKYHQQQQQQQQQQQNQQLQQQQSAAQSISYHGNEFHQFNKHSETLNDRAISVPLEELMSKHNDDQSMDGMFGLGEKYILPSNHSFSHNTAESMNNLHQKYETNCLGNCGDMDNQLPYTNKIISPNRVKPSTAPSSLRCFPNADSQNFQPAFIDQLPQLSEMRSNIARVDNRRFQPLHNKNIIFISNENQKQGNYVRNLGVSGQSTKSSYCRTEPFGESIHPHNPRRSVCETGKVDFSLDHVNVDPNLSGFSFQKNPCDRGDFNLLSSTQHMMMHGCRPFSRSSRQEDKENIPRQAVKGFCRKSLPASGRTDMVRHYDENDENVSRRFQEKHEKGTPLASCQTSYFHQNELNTKKRRLTYEKVPGATNGQTRLRFE